MPLILALGLCYMTFLALRGGWSAPQNAFRGSFPINALLLAGVSIAVAMLFFGPITGLAIIAIIAIHEFGHVAAFRVCGHTDATFRLIPLMGGVAISRKEVDGPLQDFYISIMGPAICIAPTLLALHSLDYVDHPDLRQFLWDFAIFSGTINAFNLLPIGPLDGGKISRVLFGIFAPKAAKPFAMIVMGLAMLAAVMTGRYFILFFLAMTFQSSIEIKDYPIVHKPSKAIGILLLAIYLLSMFVLASTGAPLMIHYLGG